MDGADVDGAGGGAGCAVGGAADGAGSGVGLVLPEGAGAVRSRRSSTGSSRNAQLVTVAMAIAANRDFLIAGIKPASTVCEVQIIG